MSNILQTSTPSTRPESQGQALVEFALVLMFIILPLTFIIIDGAVMLFTLSNVTNAVREGARAGAIYQTKTSQTANQAYGGYVGQIDTERSTAIQQEINARLGPLVAFTQCTMTIHYATVAPYPAPQPAGCPEACPAAGNPFRARDQLTVNLTCPRRMLFGLGNVASVNLSGSATMTIEPGGVRNQ